MPQSLHHQPSSWKIQGIFIALCLILPVLHDTLILLINVGILGDCHVEGVVYGLSQVTIWTMMWNTVAAVYKYSIQYCYGQENVSIRAPYVEMKICWNGNHEGEGSLPKNWIDKLLPLCSVPKSEKHIFVDNFPVEISSAQRVWLLQVFYWYITIYQ